MYGATVAAGHLKTVESVSMEAIVVPLVAITVTVNQEYYCSTLPTSVDYGKSPVPFVAGVSSGKSRSIQSKRFVRYLRLVIFC
jgi:hypothetical protein